MSDLLPFLLLAVLLSVTPGPDAVLVLRSSVRGGRRLGSATALGAATGSLLWGMLATVGLAAAIAQSATLYQAIRLAGAGYLIFLGVSTLLTHTRGRIRTRRLRRSPTTDFILEEQLAQATDGSRSVRHDPLRYRAHVTASRVIQ